MFTEIASTSLCRGILHDIGTLVVAEKTYVQSTLFWQYKQLYKFSFVKNANQIYKYDGYN